MKSPTSTINTSFVLSLSLKDLSILRTQFSHKSTLKGIQTKNKPTPPIYTLCMRLISG